MATRFGSDPKPSHLAACEDFERAILAEEQRLTAQTPPPAAHPRGRKRQAVENLECARVEHMLEHLLQHFSELDVSSAPGLRDLPASQQQHVIDGLVYTLTSYQDELRHTIDQQACSTNPETSPPLQSAEGQPVPTNNDLPISPAATGVEVPVPDSGSMSLTSFHPPRKDMIDHNPHRVHNIVSGLRPYVLPLVHSRPPFPARRQPSALLFFSCWMPS